GVLAQTRQATTGKGLHLYFDLPAECGPVPCSAGDGLDIRGDGGYVVAPPSVHPNGNTYAWSDNWSAEIALAPPWIIDLARNRKRFLSELSGPPTEQTAAGQQKIAATN